MKAKLILKRHNDCYSLNDYREPSKGYPLVIAHSDDENFRYKLSTKNCDEIFGVVDVEKLAEEFVNDLQVASESVNRAVKLGYEEGFKKAMELNKDKVFTLKDMYDAVMLGVCFEDSGIQGISTYEELKELAIKRASKPTEIEVEIEHHEIKQTKTYNAIKGVKGSGHKITTIGYALKLDSNGYLILKKI